MRDSLVTGHRLPAPPGRRPHLLIGDHQTNLPHSGGVQQQCIRQDPATKGRLKPDDRRPTYRSCVGRCMERRLVVDTVERVVATHVELIAPAVSVHFEHVAARLRHAQILRSESHRRKAAAVLQGDASNTA